MRAFTVPTMLTTLLLAACAQSDAGAPAGSVARSSNQPAAVRTVADAQRAAAGANAVLDLPVFERTPDEIRASVSAALAEADRRLGELAAQPAGNATFETTVAALDDIAYPVGVTASRLYLMKETQVEESIRDAATEAVNTVSDWQVKTVYREDVYNAVKAFADAYEAGKRPRLIGEDLKLYKDTMRDYRRAGLALPKETRDKVEALQKELTRLSTEFGTNINDAKVTLTFTEAELEGVPADFLSQVRQADGTCAVKANVTPQYMTVAQNAKRADVRKRLEQARFTLAQEKNGPLLDRIVALRDQIAGLLGYKSWADYQIEPRMAKTADRAIAFLTDLKQGLEPKFRAELATFAKLKAADTGEASPRIESWDWRYYENQLKKQQYDVDAEALRVYFPMQACLDGMFRVYETLFGLRFAQLDNPSPWAEGVTLHAALDSKTGEVMGLFYLDMYPREGKYNHFAQFDIIGERLRPDGKRQRPVVALVCNFNPAIPAKDGQPGKPSLLAHSEVETLFHEFGHALHSILTQARRAQFAGTNVPRDFVEAPSQMLENWVWDAGVLNTFAADYRDPSKKIDPAFMEKMKAAKLATAGVYYRRQAALALGDLNLHLAPGAAPKNSQAIINSTFADVFIAPPEGSHFAAYWGHLTGYDAGYYGYAWSKAIAEDMASAFERSKGGWMDQTVGRRLRDEVYAVGGSREADETIRAFLGREWTTGPFLKSIGAK